MYIGILHLGAGTSNAVVYTTRLRNHVHFEAEVCEPQGIHPSWHLDLPFSNILQPGFDDLENNMSREGIRELFLAEFERG